MRRKNLVGVWGVAALILIGVGPAPAVAEPREDDAGKSAPADKRPAIATFEGKRIDLSQTWGDATACLVWRQGGVLECFRTAAGLDAREAELKPRKDAADSAGATSTASYAASSFSCSSSLRLYEGNWYGGRRVSFWDRGFWQNLADYGFDDQVSSYIVGGCYAHLAEYANGWGWWYPGPTYPYAGEPVMGWQDVISSIYIE